MRKRWTYHNSQPSVVSLWWVHHTRVLLIRRHSVIKIFDALRMLVDLNFMPLVYIFVWMALPRIKKRLVMCGRYRVARFSTIASVSVLRTFSLGRSIGTLSCRIRFTDFKLHYPPLLILTTTPSKTSKSK